MKYLLKTLALLLFIAFSYSLNAQIKIGPKAGIHFGNWNMDEDVFEADPKSRLGVQFGIAAEFNINEMFFFQPELLYHQKGFKLDQSEEGDIYGYMFSYESKNEFILNYLEIPLLFKAKFGNEDGPKFFITAGPSIGYGLNGKMKYESTTTINGDTEEDSGEDDLDWDDDEISRLDLSLGLGAGAQIAAGSGDLLIEFRYLAGLSDLNDSDDDEISAKNTGFGIAVTYLFPLAATK